MLDYIDLKYKPTKNDLICEFYIEPNRISFGKACRHIAGESSIGTWTELTTMKPRICKTLKPNVFFMNKERGIARIAYPKELFEPGNMPEILSSIAGNIYGMKAIKNLKLLDIEFPKSIVKSFPGPKFGIQGIRKLTKVYDRPLVGTIVKPKVGLNEKEHAQVAYEAWVGGLDVVKDDENLSSMSFNKFEKRIEETLKMKYKAELETGEKKIYMPNITAETFEMIRRADYVKQLGGEYIMVDILTVGWAGLQTIREQNKNQFIHAHRAGHGAITKNPKHGMSMLVIGKIARLLGVDQLHVGTANVGKMGELRGSAEDVEEEIESAFTKQKNRRNILGQKWHGIKPVLAVASGGLHPGMIPDLLDKMGLDIVAQFGGGCHGHPSGTIAGAKAIRQAVDAYINNVPLVEYAKTHPELMEAIEKWGMN